MTVYQPIPENLTRAGRRITVVLFAAQSLIAAGLIATTTVLSILGEQLSGSVTWSGLPSAVMQLAAAPFAYVWGVAWDRTGRRSGLSIGLVLGLVGLAVSIAAIQTGSMGFFLLGLVGLGGSRAAVQLARFIAAEVSLPQSRGRAISTIVLAGTAGAVGGPLLVGPSGRWALAAGLPEIAGPFAASVVLFAAAAAITWLGMRPEPMEIAQQVAGLFPERVNPSGSARSLGRLLQVPGVLTAVAAMVLAPLVMTMVMGITSLYMKDYGHSLTSISLVFSAHTLGMFAFSLLTGRLVDRWGRVPVILAGNGLMFASLALAPLSSAAVPLSAALFLMGLGWNLCFVGGSALLADHLTPMERSRTQGFNDLLIALVSAAGSLGSGALYASFGFRMVNVVGAGFVLVVLVMMGWWRLSIGARLHGPHGALGQE